MNKVTVAQDIPVPSERVWSALADFGNIDRFHPGLTDAALKGEQASGVGAVRQCNFKGGGHIVEKVTDWSDGSSYTIEVTETSLPLKRAKTTMSVTAVDANKSRVSMTIEYVPKYGLIGAVMNALMMREAMLTQMRGVLGGLSAHLTGSG